MLVTVTKKHFMKALGPMTESRLYTQQCLVGQALTEAYGSKFRRLDTTLVKLEDKLFPISRKTQQLIRLFDRRRTRGNKKILKGLLPATLRFPTL